MKKLLVLTAAVCMLLPLSCKKDNSNKKTESNKYNGHEFVDLGLPSGLKWATCNLGAATPEEFGDYYAWGETEPYYNGDSRAKEADWKSGKEAGYMWNSYKWSDNSGVEFSKYVSNSDNDNIVLEESDDAARAALGSHWRIPTLADWQELKDKCTWAWITLSEVEGYEVTSKTTGVSIFLPASCHRYGKQIYDYGDYAGSGMYWTSNLVPNRTDYAYSWRMEDGQNGLGTTFRFYGYTIRAVAE